MGRISLACALAGSALMGCAGTDAGETEHVREDAGARVESSHERAAARMVELAGRFEILARPPASSDPRGEATVDLPRNADTRVHVATPRLAIAYSILDASPSVGIAVDGQVLYPSAIGGADLIQRVAADGTEDFVVYEVPPKQQQLRYVLDVSKVAGLRQIDEALELLDASGTPRLRVRAPYLVQADGHVVAARLVVEDCSVDHDPSAPWGRSVTAIGKSTCTVRIEWSNVHYPALLDPSWVTTGSHVAGRNGAQAVVLGTGKALFVGGTTQVEVQGAKTCELYDPVTGTFASTASMGLGRAGHRLILLPTGKALVAGGTPSGTTSAELYNPNTGTWAATGSMLVARNGLTATLLGTGKVLVTGGSISASNKNAELYDPTTGAFTNTGLVSVNRYYSTAALLASGKVLLMAGVDNNFNALTSAQLYDPVTGAFTNTGALAVLRQSPAAVLLPSGKVLVVGGDGNGALTTEMYNPTSGTFSAGPALPYPGTFSTQGSLTTMLSGDVLFSGIYQRPDTIYKLATGTFINGPPHATDRDVGTTVLLPNGKVLIAGGRNLTSGQSTSHSPLAELYDLKIGTACTTATADECATGVCENNFCCATACSGPCKACASGSGACVSVISAEDPNSCSGTKTCDAAGACKAKNGQVCPGGNADCASGFCADGVCCNVACNSGCGTCSATGSEGTCTPVRRGEVGVPSCAPFVCDGKGVACPTTCVVPNDCATGSVCSAKTHTCVAALSCNDHVVTDGEGNQSDCAPYRCESNATCKQSCNSVDDCVAPSVCDADKRCIVAGADGGGGCSTSTTGSASPAWIALGVIALVSRVRRKERR